MTARSGASRSGGQPSCSVTSVEYAATAPAEFKGVPAGPGDEEGRVGVAAHLQEADEAFLRDVEGAAQAPVARLPKVGGAALGRGREAADLVLLAAALLGLDAGGVGFLGLGVPSGKGHRHFGVDFVLAPLECPGAFPIGSFGEAGGLVALCGQGGDALGFDEIGNQGFEVDALVARVACRDLLEVGVRGGALGEGADRREAEFGPIGGGFQPVEQPVAEGALFLGVPGFGVPASLVLGLFEQADEAVAVDQLDAPFDEGAVVGGPVGGQLGDRGGSVADEPGRFELARGHPPRHDDLECPFAQRQRGRFAVIARGWRRPRSSLVPRKPYAGRRSRVPRPYAGGH